MWVMVLDGKFHKTYFRGSLGNVIFKGKVTFYYKFPKYMTNSGTNLSLCQ